MRIDSHQHFWRYVSTEYQWIDDSMAALRRDFLPHDLAPQLGKAGFEACVAVQVRQTLEETRWLLELAAKSSFVAGVVGWVDLRAEDAQSRLEHFAQNPKLVGVRHIVQSEFDDQFLLQPEFLRGIASLERFDLAYDILIYPRHLPVATEFVKCFPRQRFVLDHLAKPPIRSGELQPWEDHIRELARLPNVYCKLSGMVSEADWRKWKSQDFHPYLGVVFDCFGPGRLMIGSDWPVCLVAAPYLEAMNIVLEYMNRFPQSAAEAVLGGNARRFYKLVA
jgi:L-fuconolactonase